MSGAIILLIGVVLLASLALWGAFSFDDKAV